MIVYVDPQTDVDYTAFYIKGLYDLFGKANVSFAGRYFMGLLPNRTLKFVLIANGLTHNYVVDWGDDPSVDEQDYEWCNFYGKINFNTTQTPILYRQKVVSLSPGFGINLWSLPASIFYGLFNLIKAGKPAISPKKFLSKYYKQSKQLPLRAYEPGKTEENYIYSLNTLWNSNEWINNDATVNQYRANFMNACQSLPNINFEGGFVYSQNRNTNPKFQRLVIDAAWIPKSTYLDKIKASAIVFNTPAWALCHGWKLGEYLALGKAIISTPILNELPATLEHGRHIHIVSGAENEIMEAIDFIINNPDYRTHLEKNAYQYYCMYGSPVESIKLLTKPVLMGMNAVDFRIHL